VLRVLCRRVLQPNLGDVIALAIAAGHQIFYFILGGLQNKLDYAFAHSADGKQFQFEFYLIWFGVKPFLANPPHPMCVGFLCSAAIFK